MAPCPLKIAFQLYCPTTMDLSPEARARRRFKELCDKGVSITLDDVQRQQAERDRRDEEREASPLRPATDAVILDTSDLTLEQVVDTLAGMASF